MEDNHRDPTPVSSSGGVQKPFMFGIMEPDGTAYIDEVCVDLSPETLEELIEEGNLTGHTVVPLYLQPSLTLIKINDIRNSIIGCQTVNWSEHIYPLVAALEKAGIEGAGYTAPRTNTPS